MIYTRNTFFEARFARLGYSVLKGLYRNVVEPKVSAVLGKENFVGNIFFSILLSLERLTTKNLSNSILA